MRRGEVRWYRFATPDKKRPVLILTRSSALEPWLCYYCGECSEQCPRGAEPGETMMSRSRTLRSGKDRIVA